MNARQAEINHWLVYYFGNPRGVFEGWEFDWTQEGNELEFLIAPPNAEGMHLLFCTDIYADLPVKNMVGTFIATMLLNFANRDLG